MTNEIPGPEPRKIKLHRRNTEIPGITPIFGPNGTPVQHARRPGPRGIRITNDQFEQMKAMTPEELAKMNLGHQLSLGEARGIRRAIDNYSSNNEGSENRS